MDERCASLFAHCTLFGAGGGGVAENKNAIYRIFAENKRGVIQNVANGNIIILRQ